MVVVACWHGKGRASPIARVDRPEGAAVGAHRPDQMGPSDPPRTAARPITMVRRGASSPGAGRYPARGGEEHIRWTS